MDISTMLKALSDNSRMEIIKHLLSHTSCGKGLARRVGISESAISQHIKILRDAGIVYGEKKGYRIHYFVNKDVLTELSEFFSEIVNTEQKEICADGQCGCERKKCPEERKEE